MWDGSSLTEVRSNSETGYGWAHMNLVGEKEAICLVVFCRVRTLFAVGQRTLFRTIRILCPKHQNYDSVVFTILSLKNLHELKSWHSLKENNLWEHESCSNWRTGTIHQRNCELLLVWDNHTCNDLSPVCWLCRIAFIVRSRGTFLD